MIAGMRPFPVTQFNLMIDGWGLGAKIEEIVLPKPTLSLLKLEAGGLGGVTAVDNGLEEMQAQVVLSDYDDNVLRKFGFGIGGGPTFHCLGAMKRDGLPALPMEVKFQGLIYDLDFGTWRAKDKKTLTFRVFVHYYFLGMNGQEIIEIDVRTGLRKVNGIPQDLDVKGVIGLLASV